MPQTKYTYSVASDLGGQAIIDVRLLKEAINANGTINATRTCDYLDLTGDVLDVWMDDALTSPSQTGALDSAMAAYSYVTPQSGTIFEAYVTESTSSYTDTWLKIDWDVVRETNSEIYQFAPGECEVEILKVGKYRIEASVSSDNTKANRSISTAAIYVDGVMVPGSQAMAYHRNSAYGNGTIFCKCTADITTNSSVICIRVKCHKGGGVLSLVANSCLIHIEKVE